MSTYGEEILDFNRLNPNSNLSNPESDGYKLFDETLGWFLDNKVDGDVLSQTFVLTATGAYLDLLGRTKGVYRVKDETDDVYRNRILCLINLQFNKADLENIGCEVFDYVEEIDKQVTSTNSLLTNQYLIYADSTNRSIVDKFINNRVFMFLEEL